MILIDFTDIPFTGCQIMKKKKRKYFTDLADKHRGEGVPPPCRHFEKCGGCMFQDISYENQLLLKKEYINNLLEGIISIDKVAESNPLHYRNRMDMVTAFGKFGLREAGSYKFVVDIESCEIMQEKSNLIYKKIRPLIKEIEGYNYLSHKGYHRYVVIRQAMYTEQVMANFVVAVNDNRLNEIIKHIENDVDSISIILSDGLADLSFGEVIEDIKNGFIEESFDGIRYRITPNSFFQSNSQIALEMYRKIKDETEGRVLDLYSGVGSISLFIADQAESIIGVEMVQEAVDTANLNRDINNIKNVQFICEDAKKFVRENTESFDTLILDPPRSGMNPKMLKYIKEMYPKKIIYMSCNPAAFKNDLTGLEEYSLEWFEAFDMFPQTPHVETLAILKRR